MPFPKAISLPEVSQPQSLHTMTPQQLLIKTIEESGHPNRKSWYNKVYLSSEHWRIIRINKFKECGRLCNRCKSKKKIQVHHHNYRNIFDVKLSDLEVLCERCHQKEHFGVKINLKRVVNKENTKLKKKLLKQQKLEKHLKKQEKRLRRAKAAGYETYKEFKKHHNKNTMKYVL